jgi:UDP-4-amino-4,6-dideoxy-N-acetyl-beta-L-altrosamine transaminase
VTGDTGDAFLPYGRQSIDEEDIAAVAEVLRGDWLTTGPAVERFETALAAQTSARHAIACSSGTAALHMAALALELAPGDRVIVPSVTFLATANAPHHAGAEIVFADVDPDSGLMGVKELDAALARAKASAGGPVRAVFPVHLNGQCAEMADITAFRAKHGLAVIHDAAHSLGGGFMVGNQERPVGWGGDGAMSAFSFHPVKTVATGEGGAVTTDDDVTAERLRQVRNHGMSRDASAFVNAGLARDSEGAVNPWYYEMSSPGFNYRASDIHCALAANQLSKIDRFVRRRAELVARYDAGLGALAPIVTPLGRAADCRPAWHLYVVMIDFAAAGVSRGEVMRRLRERGIGTMVHYLPVHLQPYYADRYGDLALPGAERYYERALSLPLYPAMTDGDVDRVLGALAEVL